MNPHELTYFDLCDEEVIRRGQAEPCEKVAVAVRRHEGETYAVCSRHARGDMIPLKDIIEAAREGARKDAS